MDVLFQMTYGSLLNSNKQPSDSLRAEATPVFHLALVSPVLLFCSLFLAVMPWPPPTASTFWVATQPILVGEQATMTHMKAQIFPFHMSPNSYIFIGEIVLFKA